MKKGVVIFAHNSREVDYALTSLVSGFLAKKNLDVPVTLISDMSTVEWMDKSNIYDKALKVFENIIEVDRPVYENSRVLFDGTNSKSVPFINSNRSDVWELTPYDRTLMIDSDFLIFSNELSEFWDLEIDIMISPGMKDLRGDRIGILDKWVSDEGIPLYWATTVMFTKNKKTKLFFELVSVIKKNYNLFSEIYRFRNSIYRNDISFSIAKHIIDGYEFETMNHLPEILTAQDKDLIHSVHTSGLRILLNDPISESQHSIVNVSYRDVHMMNKESIVRISHEILEQI
jgi:hypothetical protein